MERKLYCWKKGMHDGIPICLGYLAVAFTFGIMCKNGGLGPFPATLMSATNLTSAGQFAALGLITASAPYYELALTQIIINLRYSLMSFALSQKLDAKKPFYHRFLIAFGVTDEIFGVSVLVQGKLSPFYSYGLMAVAIPGWALGTLLGVVLGGVLPLRLLSALSIALYGMFIAVILPPARKNRVLMALILISMLASTVFTYAPLVSGISPGLRIILLTVLLAGGAAFFFPVKEENPHAA